MSVKVAVVVGSLRKGSYNRAVAEALKELAAPRLALEIVEIGDLPLYNADLEEDPPAPWRRFRQAIAAHQAVLFVTPEYNRSIPAPLKNALDVGSRPYGQSVWDNKPAAIVSASPGMVGGFGANHHLRQPLVFLNMPILQQPEVYLSRVDQAIDADGRLSDAKTREFLGKFVDAFAAWIERVG
jgi:chromate reductase